MTSCNRLLLREKEAEESLDKKEELFFNFALLIRTMRERHIKQDEVETERRNCLDGVELCLFFHKVNLTDW